MTDRECEILGGSDLTEDEKDRLCRIRRRKGAKMKVSEQDEFFYSIAHQANGKPFFDKVRENQERYAALKARQRSGEFLQREDFLFVKLMDQRQNVVKSRRGSQFCIAPGTKIIGGGFKP
jgi:hypothetical protein